MRASTLLALCLFALGSIGHASAAAELKVGDPAPDFPLLSDPTKKTADAYGVLGAMGMANRWTFYIGKDGKIQSIDKDVKPATSAEDMAATLHELGVWMRAQ
jgi:peroxiredoxin